MIVYRRQVVDVTTHTAQAGFVLLTSVVL